MTTPPASKRPSAPSSAWASWRASGRLVYGPALLFAGLMLISVVGAFAWPATYTSDAVVTLEPADGAAGGFSVTNGEAAAAALQKALLESPEVAELARSMGRASSDPEVARAIRVAPLGSRAFMVTFTGSEPERVQRTTDALARRMAERAPALLAPEPSGASSLLRQRERELAEFTEKHPEVALGAVSPASSANAAPSADPATRQLQARWRELVEQLRQARAGSANETPAPSIVARVSAKARLPANPASPNRLLILAVGLATAAGASALYFPVAARLTRGTRKASSAQAKPGAGSNPPPGTTSEPRILRTEPTGEQASGSSTKAAGDGTTGERRRTEPLRRLSPEPLPGAYSVTARDRGPARAQASASDVRELGNAAIDAQVIPRPGRHAATLIRGTRLEEPVVQEVRAQDAAVQPAPKRAESTPPAAERDRAEPAFHAEVRDAAALVRVRPYSSAGPTASVTAYPGPSGWRPNPELLPADWLHPLRGELYRRALDRCLVVAVVALPGAETVKSRVAAQLALVLAETRQPRVLLMEADFDYPSVHRWMRVQIRPGAGFSQQMRSRIRGDGPDGFSIMQCSTSLFVLAEGRIRSPGLLRSLEFENAVNALRNQHELIVVDAPSASLSSEFPALNEVVDTVLLVAPDDQRGAEALRQLKLVYGDKIMAAVVPPEPVAEAG